MKVNRNVIVCLLLSLSSAVVMGQWSLISDTTEPAVTNTPISSTAYDVNLAGVIGVGNGQSFITSNVFDLAQITLVKGSTQGYSAGNFLRLNFFEWNPTNDANDVVEWGNGDGIGDADPLNGTGMISLFSQDFELPAESFVEGSYLHFNLGTNLALAANTAYGFTTEFIYGGSGGNNLNLKVHRGLVVDGGDAYAGGTLIATTTNANNNTANRNLAFYVGGINDSPVNQEVVLSALFSDGCVLQQGQDVPVWGWATSGTVVTVTFADQTLNTTTPASGEWKVTLSPMIASATSRDMVVTVGGASATVSDVLVGEVWFCGGQSNMYWPLGDLSDTNSHAVGPDQLPAVDYILNEIATVNDPLFRQFTVDVQVSPITLQEDPSGSWIQATSGGIEDFSGTAYFFGRELRTQLGVPVAVIKCAQSATRIEPWMPESSYNMDTNLLTLYQTERAGVLQTDTDATIPATLFNGMVHGLVPYAIKGAIWYQGEANAGGATALDYELYLSHLIHGWRQEWEQGDFPFYICQIANYREPLVNPADWNAWATIQNEQRLTLSVTNTGMAVLNDLGASDQIHPRNKMDVGERISLWALTKTYGIDVGVYSGPLYKSHVIVGNKVVISFDHVGAGLMVGSKTGLSNTVEVVDGTLAHFQISDNGSTWVWANAVITGATVEVWHDTIASPTAVRYAWADNAESANLYNRDGLPASVFDADNSIFVPVDPDPNTVIIDTNAPVGVNLASASYNATQGGTLGNANGQSFITVDAFDLTSIALVKGVSQTYTSGSKLRLNFFTWNPTNDANDVSAWALGDGTADEDPLNGTGMTSLFSQDFDLPAGSIGATNFIHFNLGTNIALSANTAYGFTSEFIFGGSGANNINYMRHNGVGGDVFADGKQIGTTTNSNNNGGNANMAFYVGGIVNLDLDGDGIPDAWEQQYFGSTTNSSSFSDWDGDGMGDANEYIAGTNPTNALSLLAIMDLSFGESDKAIISWYGITGKLYRVSLCTNLLDGFSDVVISNVPGIEPINIYTSAASTADTMFYRVEVGVE